MKKNGRTQNGRTKNGRTKRVRKTRKRGGKCGCNTNNGPPNSTFKII